MKRRDFIKTSSLATVGTMIPRTFYPLNPITTFFLRLGEALVMEIAAQTILNWIKNQNFSDYFKGNVIESNERLKHRGFTSGDTIVYTENYFIYSTIKNANSYKKTQLEAPFFGYGVSNDAVVNMRKMEFFHLSSICDFLVNENLLEQSDLKPFILPRLIIDRSNLLLDNHVHLTYESLNGNHVQYISRDLKKGIFIIDGPNGKINYSYQCRCL